MPESELFDAVRTGDLPRLDSLLAAGASRERRDAGGQRPCDLAAANGHAALAARLTPSA